MQRMTKWFLIGLVLAAVLLLAAACGKKDENGSAGGDKFTIGFANVNDIYAYCVKVRNYIKEFAEAEGMTVLVTDAKGDVKQQNDQIDNFITQKVDLISAISVDLDGSVPAVENAKNAGIPYVSMLTSVNTDGYIYVGSENKDAGRTQGEYLAKVLPQNAKVLYMTGQTNDKQYVDRKAGLQETLFDVRKDVTLLAEGASNNQKDKGMALMEDWLQTHKEFDAVIAQNDDSALGAVEALKAAGRLDGVIVIGIDGSDEALASIKAGELTMTVFQDAKSQAKALIDIAKQVRDGKDASEIEDIKIPFKAITKDNLSEVE